VQGSRRISAARASRSAARLIVCACSIRRAAPCAFFRFTEINTCYVLSIRPSISIRIVHVFLRWKQVSQADCRLQFQLKRCSTSNCANSATTSVRPQIDEVSVAPIGCRNSLLLCPLLPLLSFDTHPPSPVYNVSSNRC